MPQSALTTSRCAVRTIGTSISATARCSPRSLRYTARQFARAIVMPNLVPPVTSVAAARAYRERILARSPEGHAISRR